MAQLESELRFLKQMNIKPNYSALSREYNMDRHTIQKKMEGLDSPPRQKGRSRPPSIPSPRKSPRCSPGKESPLRRPIGTSKAKGACPAPIPTSNLTSGGSPSARPPGPRRRTPFTKRIPGRSSNAIGWRTSRCHSRAAKRSRSICSPPRSAIPESTTSS